MAVPDYIAQDSVAWASDVSVSTGGLQVVDRNTQWLRNERLPVVTSPFRLITVTQIGDAVLPTWYAAQWTCGQPLRYFAPSALRGPDGSAKVDIVLGVSVTGGVDVVAINESDGPPSEAELDAAVAAASTSAASLTSSDSTVRLTVDVTPGRMNVLRVAFKSLLDQSSPSSSSVSWAASGFFWVGSSLRVTSAASLSATEPIWVALSPDASPTVDTARPVYTAGHILSTGGQRQFYVAETTFRATPPGSEITPDGEVFWGDIGTCAVFSAAVDPNSRQHEQVNNARLRWRQGIGQALERMAIDVRGAHRARAPQYGLICDQVEIDTGHPSTWRQYEVNTTSGGTTAPSGVTVASWTFRWRDTYGGIDSYMEASWATMLAGLDPTNCVWLLQIYELDGTLVNEVDITETLAPTDPSSARTAGWAMETALRSREWAMRGQTHIADIGTVWTPSSLRVPTTDLIDGDMYILMLGLTADATERQGFITIDGAASRLVLL